ncbi:MFS transporter [Epilithonimonas hispanica]|uniref:MFS transporter n=1 Tax=Epilithonimonas hispanica TaxID=358687 RepID=A0A3D9CTX8_9FLAO|nr:MFS transporter [Epilithonimonas hispanica]REC69151.1 MFS transporter [Epilithonimonas hispanica]
MDKRILPLALGGLGLGTTEFVIMGLLPDVAESLKISIPQAGHLISSYAFGVVVGAPILIGYAAKYPPKKILIFLMIAFTLFNALSAFSNDYYSMMAIRFLAGLPHGAFFGVGTVVATRLAKPGKQAQSIAMMFTGLTLANLAMVPFVTWLGHQLSWRYAFGVVSVIGLITILGLKFLLPAMNSLRTTSLKQELEFFKTAKAWHIIAITAVGFGGLFAWFSYITPLMTNVSKFSTDFIAYIMILAGAGMVVGNFLGGILADKMRPALAAAILLSAMILALIGVFFFSENQTISLILTFICGALSMSVGTPVNIMMLRSAKNSEMMAAAFMQAAFNIGNSVGALFGGFPLEFGFSYNYPSLVGAGLAGLGFLLCLAFIKKYKAVI